MQKDKLGKIARTLSNTFVAEREFFALAARLGLEPRQNESESFVLPLHHRAVENFRGAREVEPAMGFEPATACLQNRCSTIELRRRKTAAFPNALGVKEERI